MQGILKKTLFVSFLHSQTGQAEYFSICSSRSISTLLHSAMCPRRLAGKNSINGLLLGSANKRHRKEERGWQRGQGIFDLSLCCCGPVLLLRGKLLSDGSPPTLQLWLNSSNSTFSLAPSSFRAVMATPHHQPPWRFAIPSDSIPLAMPLQIVPFLILLDYHLEYTVFSWDPSATLRYQEWIKRHLNFSPDSLPCSHIRCRVRNQLPSREMFPWDTLPLACLSPHTDTVPKLSPVRPQAGRAFQHCEYLH